MDGISPPAAWCLSVTFAMFAIGGMGGGDAKLIAATSLWMGFNINLLGYLVTSAFIGGVLTLLILSYRKSPLADLTGRNMFLRHFADRKAGVPYGVALGHWRADQPIRTRRWCSGRSSSSPRTDPTADADGRFAAYGSPVSTAAIAPFQADSEAFA